MTNLTPTQPPNPELAKLREEVAHMYRVGLISETAHRLIKTYDMALELAIHTIQQQKEALTNVDAEVTKQPSLTS